MLPALMQLHQVYNKHQPIEILQFKDPDIRRQLPLLYCACGCFWVEHDKNPVWLSTYEGSPRGKAIAAALLYYQKPHYLAQWHAYKAIIAQLRAADQQPRCLIP
jgi:hypothetical protein